MRVNFTFQSRINSVNINQVYFKAAVKSLVSYVFISEKKHYDEVNFYFCNDSEIKVYNKKYLNHDYETDIITFGYEENEGSESDIIISLESVQRNSLTYKSSYLIELLRVVIHGLLHLCGMKDDTPGRKAQMRKKENHYLKSIGILK